jgi:hypothetical protein
MCCLPGASGCRFDFIAESSSCARRFCAADFVGAEQSCANLLRLGGSSAGMTQRSIRDADVHAAASYLGAIDSLLGQGDPDGPFAIALDMDSRMHAPVHVASTLAAWVGHRSRKGASSRRIDGLAHHARPVAEPLGLVGVLRALRAVPTVTADIPRADG